jgi:hypothetical protein
MEFYSVDIEMPMSGWNILYEIRSKMGIEAYMRLAELQQKDNDSIAELARAEKDFVESERKIGEIRELYSAYEKSLSTLSDFRYLRPITMKQVVGIGNNPSPLLAEGTKPSDSRCIQSLYVSSWSDGTD